MPNITIYPIHIRDGKTEPSFPGLVVISPPRKCARGREADHVILQINLTGQTGITAEGLQEWLLKKAGEYHKIPGTVTNAMRTIVESINDELLDRNLKRAGEGSQVNGSLVFAVIKKNTVYTLIVGQSRIFILGEDAPIEYEDGENHPRGLGVNQALTFQFSQAELGEKNSMLLALIPVRTWNGESLRAAGRLSVEALARRLFNLAPSTLIGTLVRLSPGNGLVQYNPLSRPEPLPKEAAAQGPEPGRLTTPPIEVIQPVVPETSQVVEETVAISAEKPELEAQFIEPLPGAIPEPEQTKMTVAQEEPAPRSDRQAEVEMTRRDSRKEARTASNEEIKARVGNYVKAADSFQNRIKSTLSGSVGKVIPGASEGTRIPRSVLLIIAIAIPLLVIAVASSVYIRKGKSQQYELLFIQAQQYAIQAESLKNDPSSRLASLQQSLDYLDKAAVYGSSPDSIALKAQVQKDLDNLQGIQRLALTELTDISFAGEATISQIVATSTDLYLLDEISGRVFRYSLSGSLYKQDVEFDCGPNPENPMNAIGKLVDILPITFTNSFNARLIGVDASGNIEYCIPGESGKVTKLIAPDNGWRGIKSVSLYQNYLHVLDPGGNAVYRYKGKGILFEDAPTLYFDEIVPPLTAAVDIEVNGDELYILRSNGEMVECTYSHMKDYKLTECTDPAPYGDMREGRNSTPLVFTDAQFIQMRMTQAPDSSLYLLDSAGQRLYHFSLQRNLQKVMQPGFMDKDSTPLGAATAIAVSPGRILFFAFQNRIYSAPLP